MITTSTMLYRLTAFFPQNRGPGGRLAGFCSGFSDFMQSGGGGSLGGTLTGTPIGPLTPDLTGTDTATETATAIPTS